MQNLHFFEFTSKNAVTKSFESTFSKLWGNGGVWCVFSLFLEKINTERIGNLLKDTTLDLVMNSVEDDRVKLLTDVLNKARATFENIVKEKLTPDETAKLNIGLVLVVDSIVYFGRLGAIKCYFQRGEQILNIAEHLSQNTPEIVSGKLSEDDVLILTVKKLDLPDNLEGTRANFSDSAGFLIGLGDNIERFVDAPESDKSIKNDPENCEFNDDLDDAPDGEEVSDDSIDASFVAEDEFVEEKRVDASLDFVKLKVTNIKKSLSNISRKLSPKISSFVQLIYLKIGRSATWIGETIVGSGKRARYKMPGYNLYQRRRMILLILIVFFGLALYLSVNWLKKKNYESNQIKEYETLYSEVELALSKAENQILINKSESSKLLNDIASQIDRMGSLEIENNQWQNFEQKKFELEDRIDNRIRIEKPEVVADLKIWFENADPSDIVYYDGALWLTDPDAKALYKVSVDSREIEQVLGAGDGLAAPSCIEIVEDKFFIYDIKKGLLEYDLENKKVKEVTGLSPTNLGNVAEVSSYDSSVYFLVSDAGKILKASPAGSGFSYPQVRLQDESFKNAKDIEINGLIYTSGAGELIRYYIDTRDSQLTISGLNPKLESADKFELLSSLQVLILDTENKRIVVLDQPDGSSSIFKLNKQYTVLDSEDRYFNELKEIVVVPLENVAYVLDGFRVIKISLNE